MEAEAFPLSRFEARVLVLHQRLPERRRFLARLVGEDLREQPAGFSRHVFSRARRQAWSREQVDGSAVVISRLDCQQEMPVDETGRDAMTGALDVDLDGDAISLALQRNAQ